VLPLPGIRNDGPLAQLDLEIELIMNAPLRRFVTRLPGPRSQRGTMLIIALIVLVAMTLAGIATMRSVDTATLLAGNIAFRQSSLNSADQGIQAGYLLLKTPLADLTQDGMGGLGTVGYYASASATEPDWSNPAVWQNPSRPAAQVNGGAADASGNVVSFLVERMCTVSNCKVGAKCNGVDNFCGSTPSATSLSREGDDNFRVTQGIISPPQPHYRITARALGPRNAVAIVQILTR
jgi:Tfp pilus assembly protein PilX